ncbi:hypothetical protein PG994_002688 [Apiospora phragmitis]|uniref:Uncharacterized protein n=1 Tax=Apiospora phragmitis TaxID=2905665 RepID=A0ABR1W5X3_9PEZI
MASRYRAGSPESQYGPPRPRLPTPDPDGQKGITWRDPRYHDENGCTLRLDPEQYEPSRRHMKGEKLSTAFPEAMAGFLDDSHDYVIAFVRGDDVRLEAAFRQAWQRMDLVFRAPQTLKKLDMVTASSSGWRPTSPSHAIDFMWYLAERAKRELKQVEAPWVDFRLPDVHLQWLKECVVPRLWAAFEDCAGYDLFTKDQGWWYDRSYDELWENAWRGRKNAKSAGANVGVGPAGEEDRSIIPQPGPSTPAVPTRTSLTQSTPVFPLTAAGPVARTASTSLPAAAATTAGPPAAPKARTALVTLDEARKRRRAESTSSETTSSEARKMPKMGLFKPQAR